MHSLNKVRKLVKLSHFLAQTLAPFGSKNICVWSQELLRENKMLASRGGYLMKLHILPEIKTFENPISSWNYFVPGK